MVRSQVYSPLHHRRCPGEAGGGAGVGGLGDVGFVNRTGGAGIQQAMDSSTCYANLASQCVLSQAQQIETSRWQYLTRGASLCTQPGIAVGVEYRLVFIFALMQTSEATHDRRELKTNQKNQGWKNWA